MSAIILQTLTTPGDLQKENEKCRANIKILEKKIRDATLLMNYYKRRMWHNELALNKKTVNPSKPRKNEL